MTFDPLQYLARGLVVTTYLSPADLEALQADPEVVALIEATDWAGLSDYLATSGFTRPRDLVSREQFLLTVAGCGFRIAQLTGAALEGWKITLSLILASTAVHISNPQVQGLLALGIQQQIVTQEEVDDLTLQSCTKGEALLGRAVQLTVDDLRAALEE